MLLKRQMQPNGKILNYQKGHQFKLLELTGNIAWSIVAHQILLKALPLRQRHLTGRNSKVVLCVEDVDWENKVISSVLPVKWVEANPSS